MKLKIKDYSKKFKEEEPFSVVGISYGGAEPIYVKQGGKFFMTYTNYPYIIVAEVQERDMEATFAKGLFLRVVKGDKLWFGHHNYYETDKGFVQEENEQKPIVGDPAKVLEEIEKAEKEIEGYLDIVGKGK